MRKLLLLIAALVATSFATKAQMAAAKKTAPILSCSQHTEMSVQRAYAAVCDIKKYSELSGGLIADITNSPTSNDMVVVTLKSGDKYTFFVAPNTNYNTLSFSIVSPKEYEEIGLILMVEEEGDGTKIGIAASGNVPTSVRDEAKKVMEPIFRAMLKGFKELE